MANANGQLLAGFVDDPNQNKQRQAQVTGDPRRAMTGGSGDQQTWGDPQPSDGAATGDPQQKQGFAAEGDQPPATVTGDPKRALTGGNAGGGWPQAPAEGGADATTVHPSDPVMQLPQQQRSPEKQALITQLMNRAQQGTTIDANNPIIKNQTDAYAAQEDRARRNFMADSAEKNSPYNTGQQAGIARLTAEQAGQRTGQFQADLMNRELTARRDEIQNALSQWGDTLSDEEKQGLEHDLANLNSAIQQKQMGNQDTQFYAGLNQQDKQFFSQLQQGEQFKNMDDALARYQTTTQNAQFFAKLAQDGDLGRMQLELDKAKVGNQDKQFLLQLAQEGKFGDLENEYKRLALSQDNNQFMSKLAQEGQIAQMDDLFRRMQLAQEQSQFIDRLGFDVDQQHNYWDWKARGNE